MPIHGSHRFPAASYAFPQAVDTERCRADPNDVRKGTHVERVNQRSNAVLSRASRIAIMPPREDSGHQKPEHTRFIELPEKPRESRWQGVGKSPGFRMPWRRTWESLIAKAERGTMVPIRVWREVPSRPEQQGWSAAYLRYFEQKSRHVWPGGMTGPGRVIEHPETAPLTAIARLLGVRGNRP